MYDFFNALKKDKVEIFQTFFFFNHPVSQVTQYVTQAYPGRGQEDSAILVM